MTARILFPCVVALLCACAKQEQPKSTDSNSPAPPKLDTLAQARADSTKSAIQRPPATPTAGGSKTGAGARDVPRVAGEGKVAAATVAAVLDSAHLVGQSVRVTGRCMGYSASVAVGPPPTSRSDWLLLANDRSVYVVGAFPAGCSGTSPSAADVTVSAVVSQDTLPSFAGRPGQPRRFLRIK